jgi:hypothetical protein
MGDLANIFTGVLPLLIPIIAIIGGLTVAVIRVLGQQRLAELERRERIAAIERGIDPSKLPPLSSPYSYENGHGIGSRTRRAHGLFIGGLVVTAVGISLMIGLRTAEPSEAHWAIGTMPFLVGVALLIAAKVIWPKGDKEGK